MKASLNRRLSNVESRIDARHPNDLGGSIELHFLQGRESSIYELEGRPLLACEDHGVSCAVDVLRIRTMSLRKVIVMDGPPCPLG